MELQLNHCDQGDCCDIMRFPGEHGVQVQHARRWLGAELNPHYIAQAQSRINPNRSKQT